MRWRRKILDHFVLVIISLFLTACGGSSNKNDAPTLENAPTQIYAENIAIPTLRFLDNGGGKISACTADSLPSGLTVSITANQSSCEITGTPTTPQDQATHSITATNNSGNATATVNIKVMMPFITTWTTEGGFAEPPDPPFDVNRTIEIETMGNGYSYSVHWGDGNTNHGVTGYIFHEHATAGNLHGHHIRRIPSTLL